jgi:osmotically-inducible protein OsmY
MTTPEFQHSDSALCDAIRERLTQIEDIDASQVRVGVSKGKVVLEGFVPESSMQQAIVDLVDVCPGVQDIENRLEVRAQ